ncbi:MAG: rhodanese-like domain-containing protein [Planctomycetota bacterium]
MGGNSSQLFDSFEKLKALGDDIEVWPGHDYNKHEHSTIAAEVANNKYFKASKDELVEMMDKKLELPANMAEILSFNSEGGLPEDKIITPADVEKLGEPGKDYTFLDMRFVEELKAGKWDKATIKCKTKIKDDFDEIREMPHPIVSVCRSGVRATLAMMTARHASDDGWLLLEGGMLAWQRDGKPMVCEGDGEPDVIPSPHGGGGCAVG